MRCGERPGRLEVSLGCPPEVDSGGPVGRPSPGRASTCWGSFDSLSAIHRSSTVLAVSGDTSDVDPSGTIAWRRTKLLSVYYQETNDADTSR